MNADSKIQLTFQELLEAHAAAGITITAQQSTALQSELEKRSSAGMPPILWYLATGLFLLSTGVISGYFEVQSAYVATLLAAVVAACGFGFTAAYLGSKPGLREPAGLMYAIAATMTPYAVYSVERLMTAQPDYMVGLLVMALATVAVSAWLASSSRIAIVTVPGLVAGAVAANCLGELMAHGSTSWFWGNYNSTSLAIYGSLVVLFTFSQDRKSGEDYYFWGYLVGVLAVALGLAFLNKSELGYFLYACSGLFFMVVSVLLSRRVFAVAGFAAVFIWLFHISEDWLYNNTLGFGLVVFAFAVLTLVASIAYWNNRVAIERSINAMVPESIKKLLPR